MRASAPLYIIRGKSESVTQGAPEELGVLFSGNG